MQERNEDLARQLAQAQQLLAERTATVTSLSRLLARSTQSLAGAEQKNRELYAIGLRLIDRYRNKTAADAQAQREPFFGLREVQLENQAEELRTEIESQRATGAILGATPAPGNLR